MATTYTPRAKLAKPGPAEREWNVPLNANVDALDALSPVGGLCLTPIESPSTTLRVKVGSGRFQRRDGTVCTFDGAASIDLLADSTSYIYLTDSGVPTTSTTGFPATSHVPLGIATTGTSEVKSVIDCRVVCGTVGSDSKPFLTAGGGTLHEGAVFAAGSITGLKIGTSASQKLGFWNASPVPRPGSYSLGYTASSRSLSAYTPATVSTSFTGLNANQSGAPYAQVSDLDRLRAAYENLRIFSESSTQLLNALINDLKAMGLLG